MDSIIVIGVGVTTVGLAMAVLFAAASKRPKRGAASNGDSSTSWMDGGGIGSGDSSDCDTSGGDGGSCDGGGGDGGGGGD